MAFYRVPLNSNEWTLIGDNVNNITFQNAGSRPVYVNVTATTEAPTDTVGLLYRPYDRELKKAVDGLSTVVGTYVWARSSSGSGSVIVEGDNPVIG